MSHNDAPEPPTTAWTPAVWRSVPPVQQPEWPDAGELDAVVKVLGYVWWAVQNQWVTHPDEVDMGDELASATHLLLDGR